MPDKFLNKYRIDSTRLSKWDYSSNGIYFLTICTANRRKYFGEIINAEMQFSKIGEIANACWAEIPHHFPYFYLDEFVIMPNHIHGIVLVEKLYVDNGKRVVMEETGHALSLQQPGPQQNESQLTSNSRHFRFRNQGKNTISAMVGSFKSAVTKYCNSNHLSFRWQSRFHDHIIRNRNELYQIRNYIVNNPANWKEDEYWL